MKLLALSIPILLFAVEASAQTADATRLFSEGQELLRTNDLKAACVKFEDSLQAGGGIGSMLYLANCYERTNRPSSAFAMYESAAAYAHSRQDPRETVATELGEKLRPRVSWVSLHFRATRPSGFELRKDAHLVGNGELDAPIPIDPGVHLIEARAPGKLTWTNKVDIAGEGITTTLELPDLADPPKPKPIVITRTSGANQRVVGGVLLGIGIVSVGVGAVFGGLVLQKQGDSTTPGSGHYCKDNASPPYCEDGGAARSDAITLAHVADVTIAVGAAAIVGGLIVYLTAPKTRTPTDALFSPRPGGASMQWAF